MAGTRKDTEKILRALRKQGWTAERTGRSHWRCVAPDGTIIITSGTGGGGRGLANFRSQLRKAGANV